MIARIIDFLILFSSLFNLIIVVNALLKNNWGRARPNDILELGGIEKFTPWYQFSESCASNCSFVSGYRITSNFVNPHNNYGWIKNTL